MRRHRRRLAIALLTIACLVGLILRQRNQERRQEELERIVAQMPTGISTAEAEQRIGRPPDRITQTAGVVLNPVLMYSASNSRATAYGTPQMYDCRLWYCGSLTVSICTDDQDRVAYRNTFRPPRRPSILQRFKRFIQRLL